MTASNFRRRNDQTQLRRVASADANRSKAGSSRASSAAREHAVVKRAGQRRGEFNRPQTGVFLEEIERGAATGLGRGDRRTQQLFVQAKRSPGCRRRHSLNGPGELEDRKIHQHHNHADDDADQAHQGGLDQPGDQSDPAR